jgi:hypothetical protein
VARLLFGGSSDDYAVDSAGRPIASRRVRFYTSAAMTTEITDLASDAAGTGAPLTVSTDTHGFWGPVYGPDGTTVMYAGAVDSAGNAPSFVVAVYAHRSTFTAADVGAENVVVHGSTAGTARPAGATVVHWIGSVAPTNAATNDEWTDTTNKLLKRWNGTSFDALGSAAYQAVAGQSNGTDDTATLNALLAANTLVKGKPGETYLTTAPLVVRSGCTLDMTGCTVQLKTGSLSNMLQNAAVASVVRVLDAAITSGAAVLTSATGATGAFTAGMAGQAVTVQGAGASGAPLTTTVLSYQSATQVTLAANAGTTVTGQYAAIGAREAAITVIGGTWDRQNNNSSPANSVDAHNFRFRHVDGLTISQTSHKSTSGKYGVNYGDCTAVAIDGTRNYGAGFSSDLVHGNGPLSQVRVTNTIGGSQHDDLVSFTARDSAAVITDCAGDITDVEVDGAFYATSTVGGFSSALKIVAGKTTDNSANYAVRRLTASNLTGPDATGAVVFVGDPSAGTFDDIVLESVRSLGGATNGCVLLHGGAIGAVTLRNLAPHPADSYAVSVDTTVTSLDIDGVTWSPTSGTPHVALVSGTVTNLSVGRAKIVSSVGGDLARASSGGTITTLLTSRNVLSGMSTVTVAAGGTVTSVTVDNLATTSTAYPLGVYSAGTTSVSATNVVSTGMTAWLNATGGTVNVVGASGMSSDVQATVSGSGITAAYWFGKGLRYSLGYGTTVTPSLDRGEWQDTTVTNGTAFTVAAPANGAVGGKTTEFVLSFFNNSGGAMGAVTFNGSYILASAFTAPASTKRRWIKFQTSGNGSTWVEISRAAADY